MQLGSLEVSTVLLVKLVGFVGIAVAVLLAALEQDLLSLDLLFTAAAKAWCMRSAMYGV